MDSSKLGQLFNSYKDKSFLVVEPEGNHGDRLIRMGAYKLLDSFNIRYEKISAFDFVAQIQTNFEIIYIHGGGGFNEIWDSGIIGAFEKAVLTFPGIVILGPQTFTDNIIGYREKIENLGKNKKAREVYVFTREMVSYELFKKISPENIVFDHNPDTALYLSCEDFKKYRRRLAYGTFYALRIDKEKSSLCKMNPFWACFDPVVSCKSLDQWIERHAKFNKIITNRLHSAIVGILLEKEVILLPNSYHKARSMWEYSLQKRGVKWQDSLPGGGLFKLFGQTSFYKRLCHSYKMDKLIRSIHGI